MLERLGWSADSCGVESTLFWHGGGAARVFMIVYVDDLLIAGPDAARVKSLLDALLARFAGRDLGSPTYFLGIEINRDADGALKLCQRRSILELGKAFNMVPGNMRTAATPLPLGTVITVEGEKYEPIKVYMSLIGSLIYYAIGTRPDVAYAVSKLARHMSAPTVAHKKLALGVLRYLVSTASLGLVYRRGPTALQGFSDSDYAGDLVERHSTTAGVFLFAGAAIHWLSKLQSVVSLSSAEAEYIACSHVACHGLWQCYLMRLLGRDDGLTIGVDNQSAISIVQTDQLRQRVKHIDVRYHHVRHLHRSGQLKLHYIASAEQLADCLTKPLGREVFAAARARLGLA